LGECDNSLSVTCNIAHTTAASDEVLNGKTKDTNSK
jgi:hypothetical protein